MKITIVGAGAMGCLFGGLLSEAGQDVRLLDIWPEHVDALQQNGLLVVRDAVERTIDVRAFTDPAAAGGADLVILFVKHGHTEAAARTAQDLLVPGGHVLTLQNGMGNAEIIAGIIDPKQVICGTTAQGAMLLGPGRIQHSGVGGTVIGMWQNPDSSPADRVANLLTASGIETKTAREIRPVLWAKLFANVGINAITALTGIHNGELLDLQETRALVTDAVEEAVTVARALGVEVAADVLDTVFGIARATAPNRSSMGQDVDAGRLTEIGAINGYIVDRARELNIDVPVNRTLTRLIITLQEHYSA